MEIVLKRLNTPDKNLTAFKNDIYRYYRYYAVDGINGNVNIRFLPLNKGYDEHPFWLISKLEYIQSLIIEVKATIKS